MGKLLLITCNIYVHYTKETILREFQFKLPHRRIATNNVNDFLYTVGINQFCSTTFCGEAERKTRFFYFGTVIILTPFGKIAMNGHGKCKTSPK